MVSFKWLSLYLELQEVEKLALSIFGSSASPFLIDCIPSFFSSAESLCVSRTLSPAATTVSFQQDLGLRMLLCGRSDIIPQAFAMLGPEKVNAINIQVEVV